MSANAQTVRWIFEQRAWSDALRDVLRSDHQLLALPGIIEHIGELMKLESRREAQPQVAALLDAGWSFELPGVEHEPWQWAWRRPARRASSKGMRFASTNQAYNAMMREKLASAEADKGARVGRSDRRKYDDSE